MICRHFICRDLFCLNIEGGELFGVWRQRTPSYTISVTSLGFHGALQKENYRLLSVFENFEAKRLDISFRFRQAVLEILLECCPNL